MLLEIKAVSDNPSRAILYADLAPIAEMDISNFGSIEKVLESVTYTFSSYKPPEEEGRCFCKGSHDHLKGIKIEISNSQPLELKVVRSFSPNFKLVSKIADAQMRLITDSCNRSFQCSIERRIEIYNI